MTKRFLFSLFLLFSSSLIACPACNIHNYLYHSITSSKNIYKGRIISASKDGDAKVEVLEILRREEGKTVQVGDIVKENLYKANERINEEYIFSDPVGFGPTFDYLEPRFEWEVRYLMDSTRVVTSVSEAIKLLECVSIKSNSDGFKYIESHYEESITQLSTRLSEFRRECQSKKDDFFNEHRITSLLRALVIEEETRTTQFLLSEMDSIAMYETDNLDIDDIAYNGKSAMGEYLRYILFYSKKSKGHKDLLNQSIELTNTINNNNVAYFVYALAFDEQRNLDKIRVNEANRKQVALGILCVALSKRYYQRDNPKDWINRISNINDDPEIDAFISKRFHLD